MGTTEKGREDTAAHVSPLTLLNVSLRSLCSCPHTQIGAVVPCLAPGGTALRTGSLAAGSHLGHRQEGFQEAGHPLDMPSERLPAASVRGTGAMRRVGAPPDTHASAFSHSGLVGLGTVAGSLVGERVTTWRDNSEGSREADRGTDLSTYVQAFDLLFLLLVPTPTCSAAGHVCTLGRLPRLSRGQKLSGCQAHHPAKDTRATPTTGPLAL